VEGQWYVVQNNSKLRVGVAAFLSGEGVGLYSLPLIVEPHDTVRHEMDSRARDVKIIMLQAQEYEPSSTTPDIGKFQAGDQVRFKYDGLYFYAQLLRVSANEQELIIKQGNLHVMRKYALDAFVGATPDQVMNEIMHGVQDILHTELDEEEEDEDDND
jgi:hypothetical protein